MTEILFKQASNRAGLEAPALLFVTGSLLAVTIILSQLAPTEGAPMLWFLSVVMGGAGLMLLTVTALTGQRRADTAHRYPITEIKRSLNRSLS